MDKKFIVEVSGVHNCCNKYNYTSYTFEMVIFECTLPSGFYRPLKMVYCDRILRSRSKIDLEDDKFGFISEN